MMGNGRRLRSREPRARGEFLFHPPPERPTVSNTGFLGQ
jgi:hypothetical protein